MKRILMLSMLLVSLATANAKCDWSKVRIGYNNKCSTYVFEVSGTVDTCYKREIKIYKKGSTTPTYTTTSRVFNFTFSDTGYYYIRASVRNSCCTGDTVLYTLIHVECKPTTNIVEVIKPDPKVIGMYDMMGRPINYARENEITIYLYDDGTTRKVIKNKN